MELFLICAGCVLVWLAVAVVKEMHTNAKGRWEDRVMADYVQAEDTREHHQRLAAINAAVLRTTDELDRIAAEASGEIIEGTAIDLLASGDQTGRQS
jgi:hypothetical protein